MVNRSAVIDCLSAPSAVALDPYFDQIGNGIVGVQSNFYGVLTMHYRNQIDPKFTEHVMTNPLVTCLHFLVARSPLLNDADASQDTHLRCRGVGTQQRYYIWSSKVHDHVTTKTHPHPPPTHTFDKPNNNSRQKSQEPSSMLPKSRPGALPRILPPILLRPFTKSKSQLHPITL